MEFQLQHQFNEYSRLISLTIDWLDLLAVQGTLKSLLQYKGEWDWEIGSGQVPEAPPSNT